MVEINCIMIESEQLHVIKGVKIEKICGDMVKILVTSPVLLLKVYNGIGSLTVE